MKRILITLAAFAFGLLIGFRFSNIPKAHAQDTNTNQNRAQMDRDMARMGSQVRPGAEPVKIDAIDVDMVTGGAGFAGREVIGFSCLPVGGQATCFVLSR